MTGNAQPRSFADNAALITNGGKLRFSGEIARKNGTANGDVAEVGENLNDPCTARREAMIKAIASAIWNASEHSGIPLPRWLAPKVFGWMMGSKGRKL